MSMVSRNTEFNARPEDGRWYPQDSGTWDSLTTWDSFTYWYTNIPSTAYYYMNMLPVPVGASDNYNLSIETKANGLVHYIIYTSNGPFAGEETTTTIAQNATNQPGFSGINAQVVVCVDRVNGINYLEDVQITVSLQTVSEHHENIDTSTLSGSITARQIPLTRKFSQINQIEISAHETTAYALDLYVSNYTTSKTLIPRVVSKSNTAPTIALQGIDGSNKDGTVDIIITGLPEQYMSGNNLLIR